jgi:hypothetical protein
MTTLAWIELQGNTFGDLVELTYGEVLGAQSIAALRLSSCLWRYDDLDVALRRTAPAIELRRFCPGKTFSRVRLALVLVGPPLFFRTPLLGRHMVSDNTAPGGTQNPMMNYVAGEAADNRALDAALCLRWDSGDRCDAKYDNA